MVKLPVSCALCFEELDELPVLDSETLTFRDSPSAMVTLPEASRKPSAVMRMEAGPAGILLKEKTPLESVWVRWPLRETDAPLMGWPALKTWPFKAPVPGLRLANDATPELAKLAPLVLFWLAPASLPDHGGLKAGLWADVDAPTDSSRAKLAEAGRGCLGACSAFLSSLACVLELGRSRPSGISSSIAKSFAEGAEEAADVFGEAGVFLAASAGFAAGAGLAAAAG